MHCQEERYASIQKLPIRLAARIAERGEAVIQAEFSYRFSLLSSAIHLGERASTRSGVELFQSANSHANGQVVAGPQ